MSDRDLPAGSTGGMEPGDLDGHTLEELSDYLEAGRTPADPSIDQSPGCRMALDALERLRGLVPDLMAADAAEESSVDDTWVQGILSSIAMNVRAGRRIPLSVGAATSDMGITEGAVRGVIRGAERSVPGTFVGRCRLDGDLTDATADVNVSVDVSVMWGKLIPELAARLRTEIGRRLRKHTTLNVQSVNIDVRDVERVTGASEERE